MVSALLTSYGKSSAYRGFSKPDAPAETSPGRHLADATRLDDSAAGAYPFVLVLQLGLGEYLDPACYTGASDIDLVSPRTKLALLLDDAVSDVELQDLVRYGIDPAAPA